MEIRFLSILLLLLLSINCFGQNKINLKAFVDVENKELRINQTIEYLNTTNDTLYTVYLNDWMNSYSDKNTALAKRFTEEFSNKFHFAKEEERGSTLITSLKDQYDSELNFKRLQNQIDIIEVKLQEPVLPQSSYKLTINYIVKVPSDNFTRYGVSNNTNFSLKYWYLLPTIYNGKWQIYSNKDLDDMYIQPSDIEMEIEYPKNYILTSELNEISLTQKRTNQVTKLEGKNRVDTKLFLSKVPFFKDLKTDNFTIVSDIFDEDVADYEKYMIANKISGFITKKLGNYPHEKLLLTDAEYRKNPIYGLNLLPDFIKPYSNNFQYELKLLKASLQNYLSNSLNLNPREDYWLLDGLQTYYMIKYVEANYPNTKMLGKLSKIWGLKSFHLADLKFNEQYNMLFMTVARPNLDQPLSMRKDSLLKFNQNIASKYKAGIGLNYLDQYINSHIVENTLKEFITSNKLQLSNSKTFETLLKSKTDKNLDWFFTQYLNSNKKIDYKITKLKRDRDSVQITIKNKGDSSMPVSLFAINDDNEIQSKYWINGFKTDFTISIPNLNSKKLVLNYDQIIPEVNPKNNTKPVEKKLLNKPIQIRLAKDVEDPNYNQLFVMPLIEFRNIYDGLRFGAKFHNKPFLKKPFVYRFAPQYGTKSNSLTGSAVLEFHNYTDNNLKKLYKVYYGLGASYSSYAEGLFVRKLTPTVSFYFRDKNDLRANKRQFLNFRFVDIQRDKNIYNPSSIEPNYGVFNARFINNNPGLIDFSSWTTDFQLSKNFSKISFNYEFRRLFQNNRQLNIRFYAGTFIKNNNNVGDDYFSFALDRPTDYLFDYDYLGRSESTGIFSQQIIITEGGFKSKLETPFANQWMTTLNTTTSIWKDIHAYGDLGFVKNKNINAKFVYDAGIRINLVEDYFEIYFPVYSNLGWEIAQPQYSQKIRFLFTVDPQTLFGLFTRKWY